jgi:DNA-binding GntR family transcriptional regulator
MADILLRNRILTQTQPGDWPPQISHSSDFAVSRETMRKVLEPLERIPLQ